MTLTLFSSIRNEGPFLLEWVLYHRIVGFERIVLFANDNDDGSDELLAALQKRGLIEVYHHSPSDAPQLAAAHAALEKNLFNTGDWVMWLDLDEYLNIHVDSGRLNDLIQRLPNASGIAINWKIFGTAHHEKWPGRQISPAFCKASARQFPVNALVKTLFQFGPHVTGMYMHRPTFDSTDFIDDLGPFYGGDGTPVDDGFYMGRRRNGVPMQKTESKRRFFKLAQVNHYSVRTPDMYLRRIERGQGDLSGTAEARYDDAYYKRRDRNEHEDSSVLRYLPRLNVALSKLEAEPDIAEALEWIY